MKLYITALLCLLASLSWSQKSITLTEVIDRVVSSNPSIQIQQQNIQIATNNISKANTGQLPIVDAVGTATYNNTYTNLDIRTFQPAPAPDEISISEWGVQSLTTNIGVEASYVLRDGGAGQYRYQLLEGLSEVEKAKQQVIINGLLSATVNLYFELVKLENQISILSENINVNQERISKLEDKRQFSKVSDLDILQAETTLNQDKSAKDNLLLIKQNLEYDLKILMNDMTEDRYQYATFQGTISLIDKDNLRAQITANNPELILLAKGIALAETEIALEKSSRKPTIATFGNAGYFYQQNDIQQLAQIQTIGATVGINATYNLYDGGRNKIKVQNAKLSQEIERNKLDQRLTELEMEATKQINTIDYITAQLVREEANLAVYQKAYDKVNEQFGLGKLPEIALREAQLALSNSRITTANYQADLQRTNQLLSLIIGSPN